MGLWELDEVAVGVLHEGCDDGPMLKLRRFHDGLRARVDASLVEAFAIIGLEIELPERVAVFDRPDVVALPCKLDPVAIFAAQDHFSELFLLDAMGNLQAERLFIKLDASIKITNVDAVLVDGHLHGMDSFRVG